jgi:2-polyprenyl-3-methyl-5-hydroxy-6-metoxy-1,4-benzoquinol methylase
MNATDSDEIRLREFWNNRYSSFSLSESGWLGAGEHLNERIYACKRQALRRALASLGLDRRNPWSVLDAGCGQGHFARFYRREFPAASYVGIDISERAVTHLRASIEGAEFHTADLGRWNDPRRRVFDVVQSLEVLHLVLDDAAVAHAIASLASRVAASGALLITAALPDTTVQPADYLRYRSRSFWESTLASLGLRIVAERPMYYWLPSGGPVNKYLRYAMTRLGPDALYAVDRAAMALRIPRPQSVGIDSRMRLLTIQRS